jgi:hypothetical protein
VIHYHPFAPRSFTFEQVDAFLLLARMDRHMNPVATAVYIMNLAGAASLQLLHYSDHLRYCITV